MKIQIDIGHPGHVHLFKNFALEMQKEGHKILFTCRDKEFEIALLESFGFKYKSFGKKYKTTFGKLFGLLKFDIQSIWTALSFKPDIFMSHGSMYVAHASAIMRKPHISFEDTFNMEQVRLYAPFTEVILAPNLNGLPLKSSNVVRYNGYHELAYLHPNRFKANKEIYHALNIEEDEPYVIVRFVSWDASHDIGQGGISLKYKEKLIVELSKYVKVFISSEGNLAENFKEYQIKIAPEKMHDALAFSTLFIGEGATMASECAVLGTPSIYVNTLNPLTIQEQEKFGLLYNYRNMDGVIEKALELLQEKNLKNMYKEKKNNLLNERIDVTAFLIWFVKNYPDSHQIVKETPKYIERFK